MKGKNKIEDKVKVKVNAVVKENAKDENLLAWAPRTGTGKMVKSGEISDIDYMLKNGLAILEPQIVDALVKDIEHVLIKVGQSKGKFGGGKRSIWRQTQKKTREGNKPKFTSLIVVGNKKGIVGIGRGKAKETVPAREKAIRAAKLNIISIKNGCGSWACGCGEKHSIPFKVEGKCGSIRMILMPAPKGTGLKVEEECKKILEFAGIKDVYSRSFGHTKTKMNMIYACFDALKQLTKVKAKEKIA